MKQLKHILIGLSEHFAVKIAIGIILGVGLIVAGILLIAKLLWLGIALSAIGVLFCMVFLGLNVAKERSETYSSKPSAGGVTLGIKCYGSSSGTPNTDHVVKSDRPFNPWDEVQKPKK